MNRNCAVVGCTNSNYRLKAWKETLCEIHVGCLHKACSCDQPLRLFKFPSKLRNHARRVVWITKLKRETAKKKHWKPGQSDMVCSDHFVDGLPTVENPDPTLNLGYEAPKKKVRSQLVRYYPEKIQETVESPLPPIRVTNILQKDTIDVREKCDQCTCKEANEKAFFLEQEVVGSQKLKEENSKLKKKIQTLSRLVISKKKQVKPFSYRQIKSDAKMKFYTGIQTIAMFNVIFNLIKPCLSSMVYWRGTKTVSPSKCSSHKKRLKQILPHKDQLLMVLMRLRLGLLNEDLAGRFIISPSLCSNIFITWIKMLASLLAETLVTWLPRDVIKSNLPEGFKKISPKTQCIIDCTEVFIERSKSLNVQASTWSDYKKHNTIKFLVVISPHGYIMLLSDCYGGRATDQYICANSNLYSTRR